MTKNLFAGFMMVLSSGAWVGAGCTPSPSGLSEEASSVSGERSAVTIGGEAGGDDTDDDTDDGSGTTSGGGTTFSYGDGTGLLACPSGEFISGIAVLSKTFFSTFGGIIDLGIVCSGDGVDFGQTHWALSSSQTGATVSTISLAGGFVGFSTVNYKNGAKSLCDLGFFFGPTAGPLEYASTLSGLGLENCSVDDRSDDPSKYSVAAWGLSDSTSTASSILVLSESFDVVGTVVLGFFVKNQEGNTFLESGGVQ